MDRSLLFAYAETPVHPGGPESIGSIDLPIQREAAPRLPTIWGQSAKGALRDHAGEDAGTWPDLEAVFGGPPPTPGSVGTPEPGWLAVGDFRLVAFPVPTLERTFAWATSPLLLARLRRLAALARVSELPAVPTVAADHVSPADGGWAPGDKHTISVGEYDLAADEADPAVAAWANWLADNALPHGDAAVDPFDYFRRKLRSDLLVVADDLLQSLTEEHAEIVARVQLGDEKTVQQLWYSEYLPAETILVSILRSCVPTADLSILRHRLDGELLVAGGDETIGKGLMWLRWLDAESPSPPPGSKSKDPTTHAANDEALTASPAGAH